MISERLNRAGEYNSIEELMGNLSLPGPDNLSNLKGCTRQKYNGEVRKFLSIGVPLFIKEIFQDINFENRNACIAYIKKR